MTGEVTLEAHGLRKAYGAVVAVEDLSFTARAGEVVGLLGPNGAGKTTAIRVLTTIFAPTAGSFAVAGIPHTRPAEIRQRIGVLPESAGYPEQQTGAEYLRYHARLFGHSRASAALDRHRAARPGRPGGAPGVADRGLQPWDAPAAGHRPGAGQRPAGPVLRRAHPGARPGGPATGPAARRGHRARARRDRRPQHAFPGRGGGRLRAGPDPQPGPCGRRGDGRGGDAARGRAPPGPVPRAGRAARPRARHAGRGAGAGGRRSRSTGVPTGWR